VAQCGENVGVAWRGGVAGVGVIVTQWRRSGLNGENKKMAAKSEMESGGESVKNDENENVAIEMAAKAKSA
jgi:hypothetical protein